MPNASAFPPIPVTAAEIIRQVGHGAYSRGQKYMRGGHVVRYKFDEEARTLSGEVDGSGITPYSTAVIFPKEKKPGSLAFSARCSCPVHSDCKHAVALMLTAIDRADKACKALTTASPTWRTEEQLTHLTEHTNKRIDLEQLRREHGLISASDLPHLSVPETSPPKMPQWRRVLANTLDAPPEHGVDSAHRVSGALDLSFHVARRYGIISGTQSSPEISILARPLMMGARGKWIKGGLSWENFQREHSHSSSLSSLFPEHDRWFCEFYAIARPWQSAYVSHRDSVSLSSISSALLWQVLAEAEQIGVPLLLNGQEITLSTAPATALELLIEPLAEQGVSDDSGLLLTPVLRWGNYAIPAEHCHKLGSSRAGYIALGGRAQEAYAEEAAHKQWDEARASAIAKARSDVSLHTAEDTVQENVAQTPAWLQPHTDILLVPLQGESTQAAEALTSSGAITVPAKDKQSFLEEFYPGLSRAVPVLSSNDDVELPQIATPQLVLRVEFEEENNHSARTHWEWEYPVNPLDLEGQEIVRLPALGYPGEDCRDIRDVKYEYRVLKEVKAIRPAVPFTQHKYEGWATRSLLEDSVPRYEQVEGVRVDFYGPMPEFREIEEAPEITVKVDSTGDRDWFGLGIAIKMGEWYVPFAKVFEALNAGQTHLLLGDGSYFALDRPEFMKLQELLREARALQDKEAPLRISRHQAGMWEELEELAAETETVAAWDRQVTALLDISNGPVPDVPASLQASLRPYQLEGFQWLSFLWEHELGGILADDMGLGKTVQSIALFAYARELFDAESRALTERSFVTQSDVVAPGFAPFLVVAPTSVVPNWEREINKFAPHLKVATITASQKKAKQPLAEQIRDADVVITSYTLFRLDEEAYMEAGIAQRWNGLLLDEAQFVKNAKTKAHRAARDLPARFKLAVTGTPMENNLMELWSMFSIAAPGLFPSARRFKDDYAGPIESGEDNQALPRLRQRIRPLMLRRTKDLVASELPEKNDMRVDVPLDPSHRRAYDTALQRERKKVLGLLEDMDKNRFTVFQSLTTLRRMALDASLIDEEQYGAVESSKLKYLGENLPEIVADGHRTLIFSQFTSYLKKVAAKLAELGIPYLYLDGSTRDRGAVLRAFEEGSAPVFLISLKAGGFGLNLTSADYCFIMDPWWNPAAEQQAVDRVHRIGQTKNVMVYRLVSAGTIEEKVMDLKESKAALFDAVVDEGEFFSSKLTAEQVRELLTSGQ